MTFRADRRAYSDHRRQAIGTSVAYHLARDGAKDALLVEKVC